MQQYAKGTYANAICDRCGHRFPYLDLVEERGTRLRVCEDCEDEPEPKAARKPDPVALRHPRPDPEG